MDTDVEILPGGVNVVNDDGDVVPRDFEPTYEEPEELREARAFLGVLEKLDTARHFGILAKKSSKNSDVRQAGGVHACRQKSGAAEAEARADLLAYYGFPANQEEANMDAFYAGVKIWFSFRTSVDRPDARQRLRIDLEQQLEQLEQD